MRKFAVRAAVVASSVLGTVSAFAVDPATAIEAVTGLSSTVTAFGPVMWGLAIVGVGIGLGVKFIKKAKGAA